MNKVQFGLFGAGGFAREVMPFVKESVSIALKVPEEKIDTYFVETWQPKNNEINGYPVISINEFLNIRGKKYFNVAVGNGIDREKIARAIENGAISFSIFSKQAINYQSNYIAEGAIFCSNTMVTSNVIIGKFFQCNIYSYVAHDCVIGDYVTFAPSVRCNGRVHIDDYVYIGTNSTIREGTLEKPIRIGKGAIVGMGSVVTRDVPAGAMVYGNPARFIKFVT